MQAIRTGLHALLFYGAVIAFTFGSTFVHELGHAYAWGDDSPEIRFDDDRDSAQAAVGQEQRLDIQGTHYRVIHVDETTIALYPLAILASGATLGIAPAAMLPDHVLGSTFYSLGDDDYQRLAAGDDVIGWQESAMPMIINAALMIPIWIWLWLRPSALSMAAAWVNATEWRFNLHHAQELGIPTAAHVIGSTLMIIITAGVITYHCTRKLRYTRSHAMVHNTTAPPPG